MLPIGVHLRPSWARYPHPVMWVLPPVAACGFPGALGFLSFRRLHNPLAVLLHSMQAVKRLHNKQVVQVSLLMGLAPAQALAP